LLQGLLAHRTRGTEQEQSARGIKRHGALS